MTSEIIKKTDIVCPACGSVGLEIFYSLSHMPVYSCVLMSSKNEAMQCPRGNIELGFCRHCGFITNTRFDPATQEFSARYEVTQGFSACFTGFAKSLAQRLIDKYNLRQKTILEIGCGKGEFLAMICQLGQNKGVGFDPAYAAGRNPAESSANLKFITDFYSEKYAGVNADMICCRHTLEHIAPVGDFLRMLRRIIGERTKTLVFFEVPDVKRILDEGAFWDIYYEHCSYFTAGSLARLFHASNFEIDDLYLDYDGQYIIITAYPAEAATSPKLPIESDMQSLTSSLETFSRKCSERIDFWLKALRKSRSEQKTVIWGSGSKAVAFLSTLKLDDRIEYVVDINPYKHGKNMPGTGHQIVAPQFLKQYNPARIIVMNPIYCNEIRQNLDRLGVKAKLLPV
jgi:SAM-dependent methyltransferase